MLKTLKVDRRKYQGPCRYQNRPCNQPVVDSYEYCLKHILEDKTAPYKPCGFPYPFSSKKCTRAAFKGDKRELGGYCTLHTYQAQMKRQKSNTKQSPIITRESLIANLSHFVRPRKKSVKVEGGEEVSNTTRTDRINPFVELDLNKCSVQRSNILECASESDSDVESSVLEDLWKGTNEDSSDTESIDSQIEEPLKHAEVYTLEEAVSILRNKLIKLQVLYQKQFERLNYVLRERRRKYIKAVKTEKEAYSSIADQQRKTPKDLKLYQKLKSYGNYHRLSYSSAVAHMALLEKRSKVMSSKPPPPASKCIFTEGGVRCSRVPIPMTRHCFKHILEDPHQTRFRACNCSGDGDTVCADTICDPYDTCNLHRTLSSLNPADSAIKTEITEEKCKSIDESELDASATESAFSTDNRDSPDETNNHTEDTNILQQKETLLYNVKNEPTLFNVKQELNLDSDTNKKIMSAAGCSMDLD